MHVKARERADESAFGLAQLENDDAPAGARDAREFAERTGAIGHVANAEGDAHAVERVVGKGQRFGVAGDELDAGVELGVRYFGAAYFEHARGGIEARDVALRVAPRNLNGQITGAGGDVEHARGTVAES